MSNETDREIAERVLEKELNSSEADDIMHYERRALAERLLAADQKLADYRAELRACQERTGVYASVEAQEVTGQTCLNLNCDNGWVWPENGNPEDLTPCNVCSDGKKNTEAFAAPSTIAAAVAGEREACARICEEDAFVDQWKGLAEAAKRIRARSNSAAGEGK